MNTYDDEIMTPGMVAEAFKVNHRTVGRWANDGKLPFFTTPGGHKRFKKADVDKLLAQQGANNEDSTCTL